MTIAVGIMLGLLAAAHSLRCRSPLYPPVLFPAVWSFLLFGLAMSGDFFYPLSGKGAIVFLVGAISFCIGGLPVKVRKIPTFASATRPTSRARKARVTSAIDIGIVVLAVMLPFYWHFLQAQSALSLDPEFWRGIRRQTGETGLGLYAYLLVLGTVLSMIAVLHADGSRRMRFRITGVVGLTLIYSLLTVSRLSALTLITGLIAVLYIRFGKVRWSYVGVALLVSLVIFAIPAVVLQKGGKAGASVSENAAGVFNSLRVYTFGGLVAFDQSKDQPESIFPAWYSLRFFLALGHFIGINVEVPEIVSPFTPTPMLQNVYTVYGSYFANFGWFGLVIVMGLIGQIMTLLFSLAHRHPEAVILYGVGFSAICISGFADGFIIPLSYWIQTALITLVVFRRPPLVFKSVVSRPAVVQSGMYRP